MAYQGPKIYLAPYGNDAALENVQNSVLEGVSVDRVRKYADDPPVVDNVVRLWGTKPTVHGTWKNIQEDDYLFFYRNGIYTHASRVLETEENEALGRNVWSNFEDEPWDRIIYLAPPSEIEVPSEEIHDLAGYDRTFPLGFSPLNEMGIGGIRGKYGSVEALASKASNKARSVETHSVPKFDLAEEQILDGLYFQDNRGVEILEQVESAFEAGKHIIFTGPPGTGKTELARRICKHLTERYDETYSGYELTTATADWSTFETIGGYMPTETDDGNLSFETGQVLRRFKQDGAQQNELLVIDEINRADIDKAFGQLFTLLSGQEVQLPYRQNGKEVIIRPATEKSEELAAHEYIMPNSWRLLATMNTYDKTSLYELSYAFMRRFSFIHVDAPQIPEERVDRIELLEKYATAWEIDVNTEDDGEILDAVSEIWWMLNGGQTARKIGPAIVRDMLEGIVRSPVENTDRAVTAAVGNYVIPQLEGSPRREAIVNRLSEVNTVKRERLAELGRDMLQIEIDG